MDIMTNHIREQNQMKFVIVYEKYTYTLGLSDCTSNNGIKMHLLWVFSKQDADVLFYLLELIESRKGMVDCFQ